MKRKFKRNKLLIYILLLTISVTTFFNIEPVNAHKAYKLVFLFNPSTGKYTSEILEEGSTTAGGWSGDTDKRHMDNILGWNSIYNPTTLSVSFLGNSSASDIELAKKYAEMLGVDSSEFTDADKLADKWIPTIVKSDEFQHLLPLTFPAYNSGNWGSVLGAWAGNNNRTPEDRERALLVGQTLTESMNEALDFIIVTAQYNVDSQPKKSMEIAERLANFAKNSDESIDSSSFKLGDYWVLLDKELSTHLSGDDIKEYEQFLKNKPSYLEESDYMRIRTYHKDSPNDHETLYVPYKIYKGYNTAVTYGSQKPLDGVDEEKSNDEIFINWGQLVLEAHINYIVMKKTSADAGDILKNNNSLDNWIINHLDNALSSIKSYLGLYGPAQLIFGLGSRGRTYYNNVMPVSWFERATAVFAVAMILAWIALFSSLIQLSFKRNLTAISNSDQRVDMIEGYRNVIITGLLLFMAIPFFYIISLLTSNTTTMLKSLAPCSVYFGEMRFHQTTTMGYIIVAFGYLIFSIFMNFMYIYRALMATILYALSPICIASLAFSTQRNSQIFTRWLKALLSTLFLPVIHAALVAIVAPIFCEAGNTKTIEVMCLLFAFIPMSKAVAKLFGLDGMDEANGVAGLAMLSAAGAVRGLKPSKDRNDNEATKRAQEDPQGGVNTPSSPSNSSTNFGNPSGNNGNTSGNDGDNGGNDTNAGGPGGFGNTGGNDGDNGGNDTNAGGPGGFGNTGGNDGDNTGVQPEDVKNLNNSTQKTKWQKFADNSKAFARASKETMEHFKTPISLATAGGKVGAGLALASLGMALDMTANGMGIKGGLGLNGLGSRLVVNGGKDFLKASGNGIKNVKESWSKGREEFNKHNRFNEEKNKKTEGKYYNKPVDTSQDKIT